MNHWKQGDYIEVLIDDLSAQGEGVGRVDGRVVFVPDSVPGDRAEIHLTRVKRQYAHGKIHRLLEISPHRVLPACIVADKCGGCQWQTVDYDYQVKAKEDQVRQALQRIGHFEDPPVDALLPGTEPLGYRNKSTYPLGLSKTGQVQAGYYRKQSHRLINLNQCPVQDSRLDPLLAGVKQDLQAQEWTIYDETQQRGQLRHLSLRQGRRTGEQLLTLVSTDWDLPGAEEQAEIWLQRYPHLVGVNLNHNPHHTNAIFGSKSRCLGGRDYLEESFGGLQFQIRGDTFFQIYTEQAEALLDVIAEVLHLDGTEVLLDAYCGVGTLSLPLAQSCREVIGIEVQPEAIAQAEVNARLNGITNSQFWIGTVEEVLPQWQGRMTRLPNVVLLDPPRKGCDRQVLDQLLELQPQRIVYISCKPSTLARDLKILCDSGSYRLVRVQPADFFPQTPHVECVAFLEQC
ncbi:23S rRNA (uracil(1939)-C(5))-methyltransferase RlmD [Prochlorothrix hollandica]|uniref:23S rRNA (uracil(1939)-C(5))-methyltransferase RlmD n=1 Tax=Prochlorothrix hollandica TaxID=1223 RepID=UPI00333E50EB